MTHGNTASGTQIDRLVSLKKNPKVVSGQKKKPNLQLTKRNQKLTSTVLRKMVMRLFRGILMIGLKFTRNLT
ncbi:hypothetical protein ABD72_13815 [Brevibacillus laterosporus]|nr:hypothetical protein BrL25_07155 [Brevibacillus laterosporus DSM 25]MBG9803217.1 hypothetical protein [Brevibacillus laterosporus]